MSIGGLITTTDDGSTRMLVGIGTVITPGVGLLSTMADGLYTAATAGFGLRERFGVHLG